MLRLGMILFLIIAILIGTYFVAIWSCENTSKIVSHYSQKEVILPKIPFIVGAYLTQLGLPCWIITEIWKNILI